MCVDLWAVHRGDTPQQALVEQAASHGHSRSSRRPANLTQQQSESLNLHPSIVRLTKQLHGLPVRSEEYREVRARIKSTKSRLFTAAKTDLRKQWTSEQAVDDIQRQIRGQGFAPLGPSQARSPRPTRPAQEVLLNALCAPLVGTHLSAQLQRRANAIDAIISYCGVEEPLSTKVLEARVPPPPPELQHRAVGNQKSREQTSGDQIYQVSKELKASVYVRQPGERLRRCFLCVAKALTLPPNDAQISVLCRTYYNAGGVTRHFRSVHLANLGETEKTVCPICPHVKLKSKQHLQNHADLVHGIRTHFRFF